MRHALIGLALLVLSACAPHRVLLQPMTPGMSEAGAARPDYIYFVEQESGQDSRIMKCDIQPDNSVTCATQYNLE